LILSFVVEIAYSLALIW